MNERSLKVVVRTPHTTVLEAAARSLRVPTETGQVGLRPSAEGQVLAFEAGVTYLRAMDKTLLFIGTGGGLLACDGKTATLLTPLAVTGDDEEDIAAQLEIALSQPSSELEARSVLTRLEGEIVSELQQDRVQGTRGTEFR